MPCCNDKLEAIQETSSRLSEFSPPDTEPSYAPNVVIEATHLEIVLDFRKIHSKSFKGSVTTTFANRHTANETTGDSALLRTVKLNAIGFVDVSISGCQWQYDGNIITLVWDAPFKPHEERKVQIGYTIVNPIAGMHFDVPDANYSSFPDRVLHAISDNEPECCRYWLPVIDYPIVRTTLSFAITADQKHSVYANGALIGQVVNQDGTKTTRYELQHLCPSYLICVAVGDFVSVDDESVEGIPIKYIATSGVSPDDLKRTFGRTPAMVRWLQKKLDYPLPWPKYFQICSKFIGGAMENISLVTWFDLYIQDPVFATEYSHLIDSTNIHEMAHTYFGDLLVCKHFDHSWLKESWATYTEALWLEDNVSVEEFQYDLVDCTDRYIKETESYMRPVVCRTYTNSWNMFDRHLYPGGAMRIHMLRKVVGDGAFWQGVRTYIKTYATNTVETEDFRKCIEAESGINLVPFFEQWFYSKGFPKLKVSVDVDLASKLAVVSVEQTQLDLKNGVPFFHLSVDIELVDADGKALSRTVVFNDPAKHKLFVSFPIPGGKPKMVLVDPDAKLLFGLEMNPGQDLLVAAAASGRNIASRVRAFRTLVKEGTVSMLNAVKESLSKEPFWGVRVQTYNALIAAKTNGAIKVFSDLIVGETDAKVLMAVDFRSLPKNADARQALLNLLSRSKPLAYIAKSRVLTSLAQQRNPEDVGVVLAVAQDAKQIGQHAIVRAGALRGLGASRSTEAFEYLLTRVAAGKEPERARPVVFEALATSAAWQSPQQLRHTVEILEEHLYDSDVGVRGACIRGLVALESKGSIGHLKRLEPLFSNRDVEGLRQKIRALRESGNALAGPGVGSEKVKELFALVETLEGKVKKLEENERQRDAREAALKETKKEEATVSK